MATDEPATPAEMSIENFRAELDVFSGPLDLLLHLIKQEEVDIFEVPLARITNRYLAAVRAMQFLDINLAAEFLVVAATLMEIKSRTLLPPDEVQAEDPQDDPGVELVRRLLEYKEFREAAEHLHERSKAQADKFPRPRLTLPAQQAPPEDAEEALIEELVVWDLMEAFAEVIRQTQVKPTTRIIRSDVPLSSYIDEVLTMLRTSVGPRAFLDLFVHECERPRIVGIFLALLELYRRKLIHVAESAGGGIEISLRRDAPEGEGQNSEF